MNSWATQDAGYVTEAITIYIQVANRFIAFQVREQIIGDFARQ